MRQLTKDNKYQYFTFYKGQPTLTAPNITPYLAIRGLEVNCDLETIKAQNLCYELMDNHTFAHLFSNIMELAPNLSLPIFETIDWNAKKNRNHFTTDPNLTQEVDRMLAGEPDVVPSFSIRKTHSIQ